MTKLKNSAASAPLDMAALTALACKSVDAGARAETTLETFLDGLQSAGFTSRNTAAFKVSDRKAGKVSNENIAFRGDLFRLALSAVQHKGKRLSAAEVDWALSEQRAPAKLIKGLPIGSMKDAVTWWGNATSLMGKWRRALEARETKGTQRVQVSPKDTLAKRAQLIVDALEREDIGIAKADALRDALIKVFVAYHVIKAPAKK